MFGPMAPTAGAQSVVFGTTFCVCAAEPCACWSSDWVICDWLFPLPDANCVTVAI